MEQKSFGEFLCEKRKENNLTQKALAEKLFISESAVSKWEKNKANPDISMIPTLANLLGVTEKELITASVDKNSRQIAKDAKKWKGLVATWEMFFYISYGVALATCFIVNLATAGTLNWFFIVLSAIALAASFTTIPKFIKKSKLLLISIIELVLLILLLGVCCIFSNGNWFLLVAIPIVFAFIVVFLPLYINKYNFPKIIKKHNAIFCIIVDFLFLLGMLFYINFWVGQGWFFSFALPLAVATLIIALFMAFIINYTKINRSLKASVILFFWAAITYALQLLVFYLVERVFGVSETMVVPNLLNWSTDSQISGNVYFLICLTLILSAFIMLALGLITNKRSKNKI